MFITKKHLSRRAVLKGMGVTVSLPFLESMLPAQTPFGQTAAGTTPTRLACLEMVHGAAGSNKYGIEKNLWSPADEGADFDLTPSSLSPLEAFKEDLTIVSNTDCRNAEAFELGEVGADHFRTAAVFLTQAKPRMTEGSDVYAGTSIEQVYAQRFGQDTPLPSLQLSIENLAQSGACSYGYSCVYTDSISWGTPTDPLPMTRDPRVIFEQMFGDGITEEERATRREENRSILDWITREVARLKQDLGANDRSRLTEYLDDIREIERRIEKIEEFNTSGDMRELPDAPIGVPDDWEEHIKLMFDMQALAFMAGITHVSAFKMSRDVSQRVFAASGVRTAFHSASHHGGRAERVEAYAKINKYHVGIVPYFLDKLKNTPDGDGSLLDHTVVLYGSAMGDSNLHNHKRCPLFLVGGGNGALKGNLHFKAEDGTPMANAYLTLLHRLGVDDIDTFGDSTGELAI
jgi:hypothetical protein